MKWFEYIPAKVRHMGVFAPVEEFLGEGSRFRLRVEQQHHLLLVVRAGAENSLPAPEPLGFLGPYRTLVPGGFRDRPSRPACRLGRSLTPLAARIGCHTRDGNCRITEVEFLGPARPGEASTRESVGSLELTSRSRSSAASASPGRWTFISTTSVSARRRCSGATGAGTSSVWLGTSSTEHRRGDAA